MPDQNQTDPNIAPAPSEPMITTPPEPTTDQPANPSPEENVTPAFMATDSPPPPPIIEEENPTNEEMEKKDGKEEKIIPPSDMPKKKPKGLVAGIVAALLLVAGLGAGVVLVRQQQDIREKAANCSTVPVSACATINCPSGCKKYNEAPGLCSCTPDSTPTTTKTPTPTATRVPTPPTTTTTPTSTPKPPTGTSTPQPPSCIPLDKKCASGETCCNSGSCVLGLCKKTYKCDTSTGNCVAASGGAYTDSNQCENNCKKGGCTICTVGETAGCNVGGVAGQTGTKTCKSLGVAGSNCGEWGECKPNPTSTQTSTPTTPPGTCPYKFSGGGTIIAGACTGTCPSGEWAYSYCKGKNVDTSKGCQDDMKIMARTNPPSFPSSFCGVVQIDCTTNYKIAFQSRKDTTGCGDDGNPGEDYCQCLNVLAYDANWSSLDAEKLKKLKAGDVIRFTVKGTASSGKFDKAKFKINGQETAEVVNKKPNTQEFYYEYSIPANVYSFKIDAKIHHDQKGWSN